MPPQSPFHHYDRPQDVLRTLELISHLVPSSSPLPPLLNNSPSPEQLPLAPSKPIRILTSTPALEAARASLLVRRQKRPKNKTQQFTSPSSPRSRRHAYPVIRPHNLSDFLDRLATYKLANYPIGKPRSLSPPTMAGFGWTSVSGTKNRLKCQVCQASWVLAVPSVKSEAGWTSSSGIQLAALGCRMRIEEHRNACPWRNRRCPPTIYASALRSSGGLEAASELLQNGARIEQLFSGHIGSMTPTKLEHPLSEDDLQLLSVAINILKTKPIQSSFSVVSDPSLVLALFGWSASPIATPNAPSLPSHPDSPVPSTSPSIHPMGSQSSPRETHTVSCKLCHRQIGLWSILDPPSPDTATSRPPLNLVDSHRNYCPYRDEWAGFEQSDYQAFHPYPPRLTWQAQLLLIRRFVERHQHASQVSSQPHCLENLMKTFMDPNENCLEPTPCSPSDTHIWALGFVRGILSKGVGSAKSDQFIL